MKSRIMYIDRLKGIGILCVVIGHLIAVFTEEAPLLSTLYSFIYLFHMPLFSFLSGLTGKCNLKKILLVSLPVYLVVNTLLNLLHSGKGSIIKTVIGPYGLMWYLFALMLWQLSVPALEWIRKRIGAVSVLTILIALSLASGYINISGVFVKTIVFYFYFALGCFLKEQVSALTEGIRKKPLYSLIGGGLLAGTLAVMLAMGTVIQKDIIVQSKSYSAGNYTITDRLFFYGVSLVLCFCVILAFANLKCRFLERAGKNSLSVYLLHAFVLFAMTRSGLTDAVGNTHNQWLIVLFALAAAFMITLLLSLEPVFKAFNTGCSALYQLYQKRFGNTNTQKG